MNPKVSVIIPTKDRPFYLAQAVKSVLDQTHCVHEILIVNDGSRIDLFDKVNEVKQLSSKIEIFHFRDCRGPSFARNFALDKAVGEFIIFLDDDDLIHPRMIESSLALFEDKIDIVSSWFSYFTRANEDPERQIPSSRENPGYIPVKYVNPAYQIDGKDLEQMPFYQLLRSVFPIHNSLIRRSSLKHVRFPEDLRIGEDKYFWLTLAFRKCHFKCNREIHAFYRRHETNHEKCRKDYYQLSLKYFYKLLSSGMLQEREDLFYIYGKIFLLLLRQNSPKSARYLINMMSFPKYFPKYIFMYLYNLFWRRVILRGL